MDIPNSSQSKQKGKKKKGDGEQRQRSQNWSIDQTRVMLSLLREEQLAQRVAGPGTFTKQFWNRLAPILSSQSDPPRQGVELHGRWKTLKSDFYDYKHCADKTGWGWDPDRRVPVAPDERSWEELRQHNEKLYKCKTRPFQWYAIMDELCGANVATGFFAAGKVGEDLQHLVSRSDSSDTNRTATEELNDFNFETFRNRLDANSNAFVISDNDTPIEQSPEVVSGNASGSTASTGKRVREGSVGIECSESSQDKRLKGDSNNRAKRLQYDSAITMMMEESRECRILLEQIKNKGKSVADKVIKVKRELKMTKEQFSILQAVLTSPLSQDLFMSMEGDELHEWIDERIENYHLQRGS